MSDLLKHFAETMFTPEGIASIVASILGIVGGIAWLTQNRKKNVALAANIAFHVVENISAMTETTIDDKAAVALGKMNEYMVANGWRELTPSEVARAKLEFSAKAGAQAAQTQVLADAMSVAAPSNIAAAVAAALPKSTP